MPEDKKISLQQYKEIAYGEWYEHVDHAEASPAWRMNLDACRRAIEYHNRKDRPLEVLVIHGSGRHPKLGPSGEPSNSQLLLETGLQILQGREDVHVERVLLRERKIETCNNCLATASLLCDFPCSCYPDDPMHLLYPLVLKCDVLLISTGVNQSAMSTRLKAFVDRLISLDGGRSVDALVDKTYEYRSKMIALGMANEVKYDQRMFGRVAAYFITSKDHDNKMTLLQGDTHPPKMSYGDLVAQSLLDGFRDYGFYHADAWRVIAAANPDEDYCLDKQHYSQATAVQAEAKQVVQAAIDLAIKLRANPPIWDGGARINRT